MKKIFTLFSFLMAMMVLVYGQTNHDISVGGASLSFSPSSLTIQQGDSVTWTNAGGFHNVNGSTATYATNPEGFSNGGASSATWTYGFRFNTPGSYTYQCDPHAGANMIGTITVNATSTALPVYDIATVHTEDANGAADSLGVECELRGVVYSIDFDGNNGFSFYIADPTGFINVFNFSDVSGYTVTIGDSIHATGEIDQFRGLTELFVDSISVISSGNALNAPVPTTSFDESNESNYAILEGFRIVDPSQWPTSGNSENVEFTNGSDTLIVRIDSDTDIDGTPAPAVTDTFNITGLITQFTNNTPALDGYQLLPRFLTDFELLNVQTGIPVYNIATVHTEDANGAADSLNVECELRGVVYSIDFDGNNGFSFYIADATGFINIFNFNDVSGYTVTIGDSIHAVGEIDQFRGLTELFVDSIALISQGNAINDPVVVTGFGESNESNYVTIQGFSIVDPLQWPASGSSENVEFTNGTDTLIVRIDADTDIDGTPAPATTDVWDITGIVTQFTNNTPALDGYQLLPRFLTDFVMSTPQMGPPVYDIATVSTEDMDGVADSLNVECELRGVVYSGDLDGNNGYSFYMQDSTGGINVFSFNDVSGYQVSVGDSLHVQGEIAQFRGLIEIIPDSIILISSGNDTGLPAIVTEVNDDNEGSFVKLEKFYLVDTTQWTNSGSGFNVDVTNGTDTVVVRVDADAFAYDLQAPRPTDTLNFSGAASQFASSSSSPFTNGWQLLVSTVSDVVFLNADCIPIYPIVTVHGEDADGAADSLDVTCELRGVVHTIDYDGNNGFSFYIGDNTGYINIFNFNDVSAYTVNIGDSIHAIGDIDQFRGLTELFVDSIAVISQNNAIDTIVVTSLGEDNESFLATVEGYHIVDPSGWPVVGGGSENLQFTNDVDTIIVRIDSDTDIAATLAAPSVSDFFNITGAITQFTNNTPALDGYQILPRFATDFEAIIVPVDTLPVYTISTVHGEDANGTADSIGVECELRGVVHSIDFDGNGGYSFYIADNTGFINVFNFNDVSGYQVSLGDSIHVQGEIDQFRGLTEIIADSILLVSGGSALRDPAVVTGFDEGNESFLVTIEGFSIVDSTVWPGAGSSENVVFTNGTDTLVVRIDSDTDIDGNLTIPSRTDTFDITGIVTQFDSSDPLLDNYQLLPRFLTDFVLVATNVEPEWKATLRIFPNPASSLIRVELEGIQIEEVRLLDMMGREVLRQSAKSFNAELNVSSIPAGVYNLLTVTAEGNAVRRVVIRK
ncbi:MAG: plastocyanin/azurin family copper-binding protein [Bacteroidota bacterium]